MRKLILTFVTAVAVLPSVASAQEADAVAAGEALYADKCAECHGAGLRNTGATFDLRLFKKEERARFDTAVLNGKGQMPPWRGVLNEMQLDQLWAYIRDRAYE